MCLSDVAPKKHTIPPTNPMISADIGVTNPLAGVMTTSPATAPEIAPSTVGFPLLSHSMNIHPSVAAAAAKCVFTSAALASPFAASALPALNPNHPTHKSAAPITLSTTLCGGMGTFPYPRRLPMTSAQINAETPDEICTTVPPAKSSAGMPRPLGGSDQLNSPPLPHTMCAIGQ